MVLRVAELFAGVGGFRLGFEGPVEGPRNPAYKVVWSNQWEPSAKKQHATEVYTARWNMVPREHDTDEYVVDIGDADIHVNKDIHTIHADEIPDFDLLCGGFPCQDYSVAKTANKAVGIQGKKGVLWWDIRRIIEAKKPSIVLLENVDRLLKSPTSQRGRDFAVMLASLDELGYVVEWRSLNAAEYGMPQRRRRVFILAFSKESKHYHTLMEEEPISYLTSSGITAKAFPIETPMLLSCPSFPLRTKKKADLAEVSLEFNKGAKKTSASPFKKCGMVRDGIAYTFDGVANYAGPYTTLGDILLKPSKIPEEYYISPDDVLKPKGWKYLKGAKKEQREGTDGFTYSYNEGAMKFPDPLDNASRTIITGEGGSTPSRFKHVVVFRPPKSKMESLKLHSKIHASVRTELKMKKNEWIRRLTPIELERLNMFPDNHTVGTTDGKRAFFMGNALVVGIIERLAQVINTNGVLNQSDMDLNLSRIELDRKWFEGKGSKARILKSKELRRKMNEESEGWTSYSSPTDTKDSHVQNCEKIWEMSHEIQGHQLWFGKPGKDFKKIGKSHDMRPYVTKDKLPPHKSKNKSDLDTFAQLALKFAELMNHKTADEITDIYRLLARIWRPSTDLDHRIVKLNGKESVIWSPDIHILQRINEIDSNLLGLLMVTEGIARNEDVLYFNRIKTDKNGSQIKNEDGTPSRDFSPGPGRQNNVATMLMLIDLAHDLDNTDPKFRKLWDKLTPRVQPVGLSLKDMMQLVGLE